MRFLLKEPSQSRGRDDDENNLWGIHRGPGFLAVRGNGTGRITKRAARQLNEICPVHHDYMWDIQIESP